jgi:hypothetical protein
MTVERGIDGRSYAADHPQGYLPAARKDVSAIDALGSGAARRPRP